MIWEVASLAVRPGMEQEFEAAVSKAKPLFQSSQGCLSMALTRSIEAPAQYRLIVGWQTIEDHTIHFRSSNNFVEWRQLITHCLVEPAVVEHTAEVLCNF